MVQTVNQKSTVDSRQSKVDYRLSTFDFRQSTSDFRPGLARSDYRGEYAVLSNTRIDLACALAQAVCVVIVTDQTAFDFRHNFYKQEARPLCNWS